MRHHHELYDEAIAAAIAIILLIAIVAAKGQTIDLTGRATIVNLRPSSTVRNVPQVTADEDTPAVSRSVRPVQPEQATSEERPTVILYSADWCGPCQQAKRELAYVRLPFKLKIVRDDIPSWVKTVPTFHWPDVSGQWRQTSGWSGVDSFLQLWRNTQRQAPAPATRRTLIASPRWTFPGSTRQQLIRHLLEHPNHSPRFSAAQLQALPFQTLVDLHSDDHNRQQQSRRPRQFCAGCPP